ncbi:uncharacterized protein ACR2FA_006270 [Aphomia sociella]
MNSDDIVIINDDPVGDETIEIDPISKNTPKNKIIDTIIIDEDKLTDDVVFVTEHKQNNKESHDDVIEIVDVEVERRKIDKALVTTFDNIYKESKKMADFIEKCLNLENSVGMLRVINKSLLPRYREMDETYRNSHEFDKLLDKKTALLETDPDHKFSHLKNIEENNLLVAQKELGFVVNEYDKKMQRIKAIEARIKMLKNIIEELEEKEVQDDTIASPYIQCDAMKSTIVKLYSELCSLTGDEAVKRREVRFHLMNNRPQLPVRTLERLINENIGSDGNPHFPDFCDVIDCVYEANKTENLGWTTAQIMNEARALFTFCGRALQQNRQKREWRDMMSRVQYKLEQDPADEDPVLLARLEENRRIAIKKEADILDRFVKLEKCPSVLRPTLPLDHISDNDSDHSDVVCTNETSEVNQTSHTLHTNGDTNIDLFNSTDRMERYNSLINENNENECEYIGNNKENELSHHIIVNSPFSSNKEQNSLGINDFVNIKNIVKHSSQVNNFFSGAKEYCKDTDEISKENLGQINENATEFSSNNEESDILMMVDNTMSNIVESFSKTKEINENESIESNRNDSKFVTNQNQVHGMFSETCLDFTSVSEAQSKMMLENNSLLLHQDCDIPVNIKKEDATEDTMKALNSLGDSFTTTILDIEDPFLVIEISSDSSDGEDSSDEDDEC